MEYHKPVLLSESVDFLLTKPDGIYVDCTFGGGGHSKEILSKLSDSGRLIAFDRDPDAEQNKIDDARFELVRQDFRYIKNQLRFIGIEKVDGIFADLGVSSHQFDKAERGFSTRYDGVLDMRMNPDQTLTAKLLIENSSEQELTTILRDFGDVRNPHKASRVMKSIELKTTKELVEILKPLTIAKFENKFLAQVFQALRIVVNDEMEGLKELLNDSKDLLEVKGRMVVLSYHSLEDRLVKRYFKTGLFSGEPEKDLYGNFYTPYSPLYSKVITPSKEEIQQNSRARSAKLRIGIKN